VTSACARLLTFSRPSSLRRVESCHNQIRLRIDYWRVKKPLRLGAKCLSSLAMDDKPWCSRCHCLTLAAAAFQPSHVPRYGFHSRLSGGVAITVEVKR
jgi:hypothetical protein